MRLMMLILAAVVIGSAVVVPAYAGCGQIARLTASNCYQNGKVDLSWEGQLEWGCTWAGFKIEKKCGDSWEVVQPSWQGTSYTYAGPCCSGIRFRVTFICSECTGGVPSEVAPFFCPCAGTPD
jgi:hypothetical protein